MTEEKIQSNEPAPMTNPTMTTEATQEDASEAAYVEKFLTRKGTASCKTYIYPEVHAIVSRLVKACPDSGATIGCYISEVLIDHFRNNRDLMQSIFTRNKSSLF